MDNISNALTAIRNAIAKKHKTVKVPNTRLINDILSIMKKEGFINDFNVDNENKFYFIVNLKYKNKESVIKGLKRVSKLSRRVYVKNKNIKSVYNNFGIAIITTSKGVITDKEAKALGVGGEIICYIW